MNNKKIIFAKKVRFGASNKIWFNIIAPSKINTFKLISNFLNILLALNVQIYLALYNDMEFFHLNYKKFF